jgi:signal recognition particle subunit SRP68
MSKASEQDVLEARAYQSSLAGSEEFEKNSGAQKPAEETEKGWKLCLKYYSIARVIYAALLEREKKDLYKTILADTVDPTIRYAAYQARLSRTIAISTVAKRYFPQDDEELVRSVERVDEHALKDKTEPKTEAEKEAAPQEIPESVTWRGRKAKIVDASIGQALASVASAEAKLHSYLSSNQGAPTREKAAAYDDVLVASQDAADATKRAIDELEKEGVDESDSRMQNLRVTSLSVNYDLVSWRVGRYRVLIGQEDGLTLDPLPQKKPKRPRKDGTPHLEKEEARGRKLARLRERTVLYDAIIQSINSVKDLRGAMRDESFVAELDGKAAYFRALKCLNISYSHTFLDNHLNALALLKRGQSLAAAQFPSPAFDTNATPPTLVISASQLLKVRAHIASLTCRMHAIADMRTLEANSATAAEKNLTSAVPLVQRLNDYPAPGTHVDLTNLVTYPPKIEPVPVKPLFLDVAFNYIEYPGRQAETIVSDQQPAVNDEQRTTAQQQKKGWFSFGRS